jgi:hypothetical protein
MNINIFLLLLFLHIEYTIAKLIGCSSLRTKIIELEDSNNKLKNYYRTIHNSSCIHCPDCTVSYWDSRANDTGSRVSANITNIHTLCPKGKIIGNNKFATLGSCVKKEYMPYNSIQDKCPSGSIVNRNSYTCTCTCTCTCNCTYTCTYTPCSIGYYEKNNTCVECPIRTYSDNIGMSICNVCNNKKSFAYMTSDSIFNSIFYNIEYISDNINPIAAKIYNHRKEIFDITCSIIIVYGLLLFFNK